MTGRRIIRNGWDEGRKIGQQIPKADKIAPAQLPMKLSALKGANKEPKIIINSDGGANYKAVVAVLDEVRKAGISKIGINTDKK